MHRAISGDLQNEEEMDRAMEDSGEEGIYQVTQHSCLNSHKGKKCVCNCVDLSLRPLCGVV